MATPVFHSGYTGTCMIDVTSGTVTTQTEIPIARASGGPSGEIVQFKNSLTKGTIKKEMTFRDDTSLTLDLDFDSANNPYLAANGGLKIGSIITNVNLYLTTASRQTVAGYTTSTAPVASTDPHWSYASVIIKSTPFEINLDGKLVTRIMCEANGAITEPAV